MVPNAHRMMIYGILVAVIIVGSINFLLFRILYDSFGIQYAFFVSQAVNFIYCIIGGIAIYPKMWDLSKGCQPNYSEIGESMRNLSQKPFLIMAFLDCCGTFLAAMGAVFTPGQIQVILNQSLVPFTMITSIIYLKTKYSFRQTSGAVIILLGALIAASPTFVHPASNAPPPINIHADANKSTWVGNLLYLSSLIPMALSVVYKESRFTANDIHPLYLSQWVSIYQFLFGFAYAPLQVIPGMASEKGLTVQEIVSSFGGGWDCFLEKPGACPQDSFGTFWLLISYVIVNFVFITLGLYLTKYGGASINSMSFSMLLPLSTLSNAFPLLGKFREQLQPLTLVGLVCVLLGFLLYEKGNPSQDSVEESKPKQGEYEQVTIYPPVAQNSSTMYKSIETELAP